MLTESIGVVSLTYERGFYGRPGGFGRERYKAAYRPGLPCPVCGAAIKKIRTG